MSAKDYLCKIKYDREYIRQLRLRKETMHIDYNGISGIDYSRDKIKASPVNKLEEQAWKLLETMQDIDKSIAELSLDINRKLDEIHSIDNGLYSKILFMRYSEYKSFERIAVDLNYNYHYVCQLHGEALKLFTEKVLTNSLTNLN